MDRVYLHPIELIGDEVEADRWKYLALHHELTELPNRRMLYMSIEAYMQMAQESKTNLAVIFVDLNKFKKINDIFGHFVGDAILKDVAARLLTLSNNGIHAFHFSGDEFVLIIEQVDYLDEKIKQLIEVFDTPFSVENNQLHLGASIGISLFPEHSQNANELIEYADRAMYRAKSKSTIEKMYSLYDGK